MCEHVGETFNLRKLGCWNRPHQLAIRGARNEAVVFVQIPKPVL